MDPQRRNDPAARQQERPAAGMDLRAPKGRCGGSFGRRLRHNLVDENPRKYLAIRPQIGMVRPETAHVRKKSPAADLNRVGNRFSDQGMRANERPTIVEDPVKVIASSLRK